MRSIRLDDALDKRLHAAAKAAGEPVSTFIRKSIEERIKKEFRNRLDVLLAEYIGSVRSARPTDACDSEAEFARIMDAKFPRGY